MATRIATVGQVHASRVQLVEIYRYRIEKVKAGANNKIVFDLILSTVVNK